MAKVQFSAVGITDMRAKLNGQVFSRNRGGAFVRTKVTPNNPRTTAQQLVRGFFGSISQGWSGLTEEQRASWNNAVDNWKRTDVFGNLRTPSGKALYQRLNNELQVSGQAQLQTAPGLVEIPALNISGVVIDGDDTFVIDYTTDLTGLKVLVYATPPLSAGTTNANNRFRLISVFDGGDSAQFNIITAYNAKFGAIPANPNIQVRVKLVAPNGQVSSLYQEKAVVL